MLHHNISTYRITKNMIYLLCKNACNIQSLKSMATDLLCHQKMVNTISEKLTSLETNRLTSSIKY